MNSEPQQEVIDTLPVHVVEALNRSEVDLQIKTAKQYPRSIQKFKNDALAMATLDEETAAGCFYALKRDGKVIEGPSVRLAEIVTTAWGNLRCGSRLIDIGEKFVTAQAICHDLERNVAVSMECKRRITTKTGRRYGDDMIGVTANAAAGIAFRNAVFKVIPMVYTRSILRAARTVAVGDAKTLATRRHEMVDYFGKMGVDLEHILYVLSKPGIDEIGLEDLALLKGLATAIKDGDTTIEQAFPEPTEDESGDGRGRTATVGAKVKEQVAALKNHAPTEAAPDAAEEQPPAEVAEPATAPAPEPDPPIDLTPLQADVVERLSMLTESARKKLLEDAGIAPEAAMGGVAKAVGKLTTVESLSDLKLACVDAAGKAKTNKKDSATA